MLKSTCRNIASPGPTSSKYLVLEIVVTSCSDRLPLDLLSFTCQLVSFRSSSIQQIYFSSVNSMPVKPYPHFLSLLLSGYHLLRAMQPPRYYTAFNCRTALNKLVQVQTTLNYIFAEISALLPNRRLLFL